MPEFVLDLYTGTPPGVDRNARPLNIVSTRGHPVTKLKAASHLEHVGKQNA